MRALFAITVLASAMLSAPAGISGAGPGTEIATGMREPPQLVRPAPGSGDRGSVIEPPPIADAQPYPRGMVIAPPEVGDRMNLADPSLAASARSLWRRLESGIGAAWRALQPPAPSPAV
jgi:hypothetical protein